jgi:uracil-DNA glycosylase family 4
MNKLGIENKDTISNIHGHVFENKYIFIPLYHPAVALYNPNKGEELKKDFEVIKKYVD